MKKKQLIRFLFFASLIVWVGCTEVDVKYPGGTEPEPVDPETESEVTITPTAAMPGGTKYYFYPVTGGEPTVLDARADGSLSDKLPFGTYRLLAVNADAEGVEFRNMSEYAAARVSLKSGEQPADVYLLSIGNVVVEEGKTAAYSGAPTLLTHTMTLNLDFSASPETVTAVVGTLNGFYPGVSLASGAPVIADAATTTVAFANEVVATRANASAYPVTIRSFGLLNPQTEGYAYDSTLEFQVFTAMGTYPVSINLTTGLAGEVDEFGNLPSGVQIPIAVDDPTPVDPIQSNPTGGADDWGTGGGQDGELRP